MKFIKLTTLTILVFLLVVILLRGWIFRQIVAYHVVGQKYTYSTTDKKLIEYIEINIGEKKVLDIEDIIELGLSETARQLNFAISQNDNDPNKLIFSKTAHCIGYAAFFTTTCNYLLKKYDYGDKWQAKTQIGKLSLFGVDIHQFFNSAFFKDHDFVTIENKVTGEILTVDPTINDYLYIDFVSLKK